MIKFAKIFILWLGILHYSFLNAQIQIDTIRGNFILYDEFIVYGEGHFDKFSFIFPIGSDTLYTKEKLLKLAYEGTFLFSGENFETLFLYNSQYLFLQPLFKLCGEYIQKKVNFYKTFDLKKTNHTVWKKETSVSVSMKLFHGTFIVTPIVYYKGSQCCGIFTESDDAIIFEPDKVSRVKGFVPLFFITENSQNQNR